MEPIPIRLQCPECHKLHIDEGEFATRLHHTHSCQYCGMTWRPAIVATVGVRFLPGFKNAATVPSNGLDSASAASGTENKVNPHFFRTG